MTPALVTELKRLSEEAQPAPWKVGYSDGSGQFDEMEGKFSLSDARDDCVLHANLCDEPIAPQLIVALRNAAPALLEAVETMHAALERCGHTPLKPKGTWPTSEEIYQDRLERVQAAQEALARVAGLLGEGREK